MLTIYKTIRKIFETKDHFTDERREGFKECLLLFATAIEKHTAYNPHLENVKLRKELSILNSKLYKLENSPVKLMADKEQLEATIKMLKTEIVVLQEAANKKNKLIKAYKAVVKEHCLRNKVTRSIFDLDILEKECNPKQK